MKLFASPELLIGGLLAGVVFGFILQRSRVAEFDTIVGQFLLRDFTVLKVMLTAMIVGGVGVYALHQLGFAEFHIKSTVLGGNIVGGLIFGAGMAILGYCPGTAVAAAATGAKDALWGMAGMMVGAFLYAVTYPLMKTSLLGMGSLGKVTLPVVTGISPWFIFGMLALIAVILFRVVDRGDQAVA